VKATHIRLGVKFGGRCPICKRDTGSRSWELSQTALYRSADGKFHPVHPKCAGGSTKSKVGGGAAYRQEPKKEIEF